MTSKQIENLIDEIKEAVDYWKECSAKYEINLYAIIIANTVAHKKHNVGLHIIGGAFFLLKLLYDPITNKELGEKVGMSGSSVSCWIKTLGWGADDTIKFIEGIERAK